jgi:Golgi apparatus protein 1
LNVCVLQRKQQDKLSSQCEAQLFRKEAEDADDIRLSVRLFRACLPDKKAFCSDVPPGQARVSQCLEEHREALSEPCRSAGMVA